MPRSRLSVTSFLLQARTARSAPLRLPLLAPLLASALAAMAACGSAAPPAPTASTSAASPKSASSSDQPATASGVATSAAASSAEAPADDSLAGVLDEPAKPWTVSQWFNSSPLTLDGLRGKVVLVRWFTDPSCPFCTGTAPALRALDEKYRAKGLAVIGMYHHKQDAPLDAENVNDWIKQYGYKFPVAIDKDWSTLNRWWLDGHPQRGWTSVSFLLDKTGVIRRVHLGGKIAAGAELDAMTADIERLLAQT